MNPFDCQLFQPRICEHFARIYSRSRIATCYLVYGPEGTGQWPVSVWFAALVNCKNQLTGESGSAVAPCLSCTPCKLVISLNHEAVVHVFALPPMAKKDDSAELAELTDIARIQKLQEPFRIESFERNTTIRKESALQAKHRVELLALPNQLRVVLIDQIERMRGDTMDSLLKFIEEPPSNTVIVMTSSKLDAVPATVLSRAQKLRCERVPEDKLTGYLTSRYGTDESSAKLIAHLSEGSVGRAAQLAQQLTDSDSSVRDSALRMFLALCTNRPAVAVGQTAEFFENAAQSDVTEVLRHWQLFLRDCVYWSNTQDESRIVNKDAIPSLKTCATHFQTSAAAVALTTEIKKVIADMRRNVHIQPAMVALVLRMSRAISIVT